MASAFRHQSDFINCPYCQSLCLSPTILPCGHLICRKCLRLTLEDKEHNPACIFCNHIICRAQGKTISELANQLGKDVILEDLVMEQLAGQGEIFCLVCPNKAATKMCVDCGDMYCDGCSVGHKRMRATKDHEQQDLPLTLSNNSITVRSKPRPQHDVISSLSSEDIICNDYDPRPRPRPRQNPDLASLQQEASNLREKVSRLREVASIIRTNMAQLQQLERQLEGQEDLLAIYISRLDNPGSTLLKNAQALLPRLRRVHEDCRLPPESTLTSLTQLADRMMQSETETDPMTSVPTRTFVFKPEAAGDTHKDGPYILAILATDDGRLVMTDTRNSMVKVADGNNPATRLLFVQLKTQPLTLAHLPDGQVAVTAFGKRIYFVDVTGPTVVSQVLTARQYTAVGSVTEHDTLVVGCSKNSEGPASVDLLTRSGLVLKTVIDCTSLTDLFTIEHLYVHKQMVWISGRDSSAILKVDLETGCMVGKYRHPDLSIPSQVVVDRAGNCYVANVKGRCVLVLTSAGQWRRLLNGAEHSGDTTRQYARGVCLTDWGVVVMWDGWKTKDSPYGSIIAGYKLT